MFKIIKIENSTASTNVESDILGEIHKKLDELQNELNENKKLFEELNRKIKASLTLLMNGKKIQVNDYHINIEFMYKKVR